MPSGDEEIYAIVRQIPRGRVATYGQIAHLVGPSCDARRVGWALAALGERRTDPVPWHRVVNAKGTSSLGGEQVTLLRDEGVVFDSQGRIDLRLFGWNGLSQEESEGSSAYSLFG